MKKIIKTILSILMFLSLEKIKALTYSDWSENYPEGVNEKLIESEDRYKWYIEKRINEEYLMKEEGTQEFVDETDTKINEYILQERPASAIGRTITNQYEEITVSYKDTTHILIDRSMLKGGLEISEIEIINKETNNVINYELENLNYKEDYSYINDNNKDKYISISLSELLHLKLDNNYDLNNLKIVVYYKHENENNNYLIIRSAYKKYYYFEYQKLYFENCSSNCSLSFEMNNQKDEYTFNYLNVVVKDTLYKKYDIEKIYDENYYKEKDGYIKNESTKKTFYRYITDEYVLVDGSGNIIKDTKYCVKHYCLLMHFPKTKTTVKIVNPQTSDPITNILMQMIISSLIIILIILTVVIKIYNKKKKKYSSFVESI